ncbi:hypothetical protein [Thermosynechococcus sp. Uc]|uniref:hypothetical protein n=1 Tax=Thermosynechococcus sp. Uc TaxID=3034853 RepID=UPI002606C66E|nr:hypothetical protein [Thermosynechococcus sp. Uc]
MWSEHFAAIFWGEPQTFLGTQEFMAAHGVEVIDLNLEQCQQLMRDFLAQHPPL